MGFEIDRRAARSREPPVECALSRAADANPVVVEAVLAGAQDHRLARLRSWRTCDEVDHPLVGIHPIGSAVRPTHDLDALDIVDAQGQAVPPGIAPQRAVDGAPVDHDLDPAIVSIAEPMTRDRRLRIGDIGDQKTRCQTQKVVDLGKTRGCDHLAIDDRDRRWRIQRRLRKSRRRQHERDLVEKGAARPDRRREQAGRREQSRDGPVHATPAPRIQSLHASLSLQARFTRAPSPDASALHEPDCARNGNAAAGASG